MFWMGLLAAVASHALLFWLAPGFTAEDYAFYQEDLEVVELPPEIEIPPPPEQIQRPATPVVSEVQLDEDVTITPTTFEDNPPEEIPPPRAVQETQEEGPRFVPHTVGPELKNRDEMARVLQREYPSSLRDAGIGGVVLVWIRLSVEGEPLEVILNESSGYAALDEAALRVAHAMEFSPALNRDQPVSIWISIPIRFQVR